MCGGLFDMWKARHTVAPYTAWPSSILPGGDTRNYNRTAWDTRNYNVETGVEADVPIRPSPLGCGRGKGQWGMGGCQIVSSRARAATAHRSSARPFSTTQTS
jgi:hypothetical protein